MKRTLQDVYNEAPEPKYNYSSIAFILGITTETLSVWRKKEVGDFTENERVKIAKLLRIEQSNFLYGEEG